MKRASGASTVGLSRGRGQGAVGARATHLNLPRSLSCSQMWCGMVLRRDTPDHHQIETDMRETGRGRAHLGVPGPAVQAADHSMLGIARTSSLRLGVPECLRTGTKRAPSDVCATAWSLRAQQDVGRPHQTRWSRKMAEPAGAPTSVERRIHSGSSSVLGGC